MDGLNLLTPEQVAERLQLDVGTLANWRSKKRGPAFIKLGARTVRYREEALAAYLVSLEPLSNVTALQARRSA